MPLVALEPPKEQKNNQTCLISRFLARPLHIVPDFKCQNPANYNDFFILRCMMALRAVYACPPAAQDSNFPCVGVGVWVGRQGPETFREPPGARRPAPGARRSASAARLQHASREASKASREASLAFREASQASREASLASREASQASKEASRPLERPQGRISGFQAGPEPSGAFQA